MMAEQVLESQFHMGITCSQDMHAEQALKLQNYNFMYHLQPVMHAEQV